MYGGVLKQAKAALDEALALRPDHVLSMVRLSIVHGQMQDPKKAIAELERAKEAEPKNPVTLYFLAQMLPQAAVAEVPVNAQGMPVNQNDPRLANAVHRAEALYKECLDNGMDNAMVHINLAQLRAQVGDAAGARESLQTAEKRWPDLPIVHVFKGQHALPGDPATAFKCWDRAAELDPSSPLPGLQKAHVLLQSQSTMMEGMKALRECVEREPRFDPAHQLLGQLCMQAQDWTTAIKHFDESIKYVCVCVCVCV
jgi:predicted Zn-dependent protease